MQTKPLPDTIRTILDQAGGLGLRGAFTYIGAQKFTYRCAEPVGEYRSGRMSELKTDGGQGFIDYEVGLQCRVNGKPGRAWTLIVAYEPDDTYTVWLIEAHAGRQPDSMVLACQRDVYWDNRLARPSETFNVFIGAESLSPSVFQDHTHSRNWFKGWPTVIADIEPNRFRSGGSNTNHVNGSANYLYADGRVASLKATALKQRSDAGENFAKPLD